ncbi:MAG TPA: phosphatase domain-containing protein [Thermoanaerobaculia bacterium]|nr:phosphatase domain-containing protein [Thermoanaerobaculia bacterium]
MKRIAHRLLHRLDESVDARLARRGGGIPPGKRVVIHPFRGFGRRHELLLRGRVLIEKRITRVNEAEPLWRNLLNTYRRFQSDEIGAARVVATHREAVVETLTDGEGYFQLVLAPAELDLSLPWHEVALALPDHGITATGLVLVPRDDAQFGIISDIDDTIVQTNATSVVRMARTIIRNAASRLPFDGVVDLYRALHAGRNPVFYVSSSPWNFHDLLQDFMDLHGIPHGPMFLQDWGIDEETLLTTAHETHKLEQIQLLLDYYPHLRFVLIGDSGQHDPEIYLRVIQSRPERIAAAFIRDVTHDLRDQAVAHLLDEARTAGVEMLYVRDSAEALHEARRLGLCEQGE